MDCNSPQHVAIHDIMLQHAATHSNHSALQHTATCTCCNILQRIATYCNMPQHTATHCSTPQYLQCSATHCKHIEHVAPHCSRLRHTAADCDTLPHSFFDYRIPKPLFLGRVGFGWNARAYWEESSLCGNESIISSNSNVILTRQNCRQSWLREANAES